MRIIKKGVKILTKKYSKEKARKIAKRAIELAKKTHLPLEKKKKA